MIVRYDYFKNYVCENLTKIGNYYQSIFVTMNRSGHGKGRDRDFTT